MARVLGIRAIFMGIFPAAIQPRFPGKDTPSQVRLALPGPAPGASPLLQIICRKKAGITPGLLLSL